MNASASPAGSADPDWLRLARLLADGSWRDCAALADALGVSRSAAARLVQDLEARGLTVEQHRVRGCRLPAPLELLDAARLLEGLATGGADAGLVLLPEVDSTNRWLRSNRRRFADRPLFCLAELQTSGRGRQGRRWISAPARNLTLSLGWTFQAGVGALNGLSLVMGLCAAEALSGLGLETELKWPNDLQVDGRKVGGILVEVSGEAQGPAHAVIGLGINLDQGPEPAIDQPFTDVRRCLGHLPSRNELALALMVASYAGCRRFAAGGLSPWLAAWSRRDALLGRRVRIEQAGEAAFEGVAKGIDGSGRLLVAVDGRLRPLAAGEASVRREAGDA